MIQYCCLTLGETQSVLGRHRVRGDRDNCRLRLNLDGEMLTDQPADNPNATYICYPRFHEENA